ncbi:16S rRNA (adenine(1518)-N(6)/adenine(1519)-N(6))-dimethyltransferase RsmA [bacterium]|nr:16S rRNA (adenine(1518)-N(6)/adenine(1519)-N(6))-dimethyltransferase RsmA [bacterium]
MKENILFKFKPQKKWGQNFLTDKNIVQKILKEANITEQDLVLEIGAGKGILTAQIIKKAGKVFVIEIDKNLCLYLEKYLPLSDKIKIIQADFLKCDLEAINNEKLLKFKIIANLPYYITTPIIMKLLKQRVWTEALLMMQKEVAQRIIASPGNKDYSRISIIVNYYCEVKLIGHVSPEVFFPQPKVTSAIIKLVLRKTPLVNVKSEDFFFALVKTAFSERRKTLINNLMKFPGLNLKKEILCAILSGLNISSDIRGERLSIEQFAKLSNLLINFFPN